MAATWSRSASYTRRGSWLATSRVDTFACAWAGMIVFAPSPWNPPQIPFTSRVGRVARRSSVVQPASPTSSDTGISARYASSSNGSAAIAARSSAVSGTTSS